jgi:hypothetical protein
MNRHRPKSVVLFAAATLVIASIVLYEIRPLAGITFGSGAIVLAVLAHLGVLAAVVGPFVAWRRRRRPPQLNRRK